MDKELNYEIEAGIPENWEPNTVFIMDGKGNLIEVVAPDDEEE